MSIRDQLEYIYNLLTELEAFPIFNDDAAHELFALIREELDDLYTTFEPRGIPADQSPKPTKPNEVQDNEHF